MENLSYFAASSSSSSLPFIKSTTRPWMAKVCLACACGLEGYAGWSSLPGRRGAGGIGWDILHIFVGLSFVGDVCDLDWLLENGLAAVDLGDDCVDLLPVVGDAAIGGIVAVPTDGGVEDVKVGQIDERDAAGGTIDQEPSAALPFPVRRGFLGKAVVDAEGAADYEEAIGYVVGGAKCEFLDVGSRREEGGLSE